MDEFAHGRAQGGLGGLAALAQLLMDRPSTDDGSEFDKHFSDLMGEQNVPHWHTFPRSPKMNAHCERPNRTLQDEFVDFHDALLFTDLPRL